MTESTNVPVWTLSAAQTTTLPVQVNESTLTPQRLAELRGALAAFADSPLVTLEAHPLEKRRDPSAGLRLDSASPLAIELSRLVARTPKNVTTVPTLHETGEVLYRMVVPAKVAAQVGKGLVKPMTSRAVSNGVYGDLVDGGSKIAAKASFVPVTAASAGAGASAGAAAGTATAAAALTMAAPLVLMAVAVGASAHADQQRQRAIENITELLEKLHDDKLEDERNGLDSCRDAIDKATALLLDQGRVGASLGLDSAVHAIDTAIQKTRGRLTKWEAAVDKLSRDRVEVAELEAAFGGISEDGGEFRTHVELAGLAIALKRRVIVLQGVEAGQSDPDNPFQNFVRSLNDDQQRVDELESRLTRLLARLSALELRPARRLNNRLMTRERVQDLLNASYRLRALADDVAPRSAAGEVVIEIERQHDGKLLVLPAQAV